MAAATAILSLLIPVANEAMRLADASSIQPSRTGLLRRIMAWNLSSRVRASTRVGTQLSMAAMVTASALLRWLRVVVIRRAMVLADGTRWSCWFVAFSARRRRVAHS